MTRFESVINRIIDPSFSRMGLMLNPHLGAYPTVEHAVNIGVYKDFQFVSKEEMDKCIKTNCVWFLHWGAGDGVSFYSIAASSIDALLTDIERNIKTDSCGNG